MLFSCLAAPSLVVVDDDNEDDETSESNLGCFLGGGVATEASLSMEDLRFEPYKLATIANIRAILVV